MNETKEDLRRDLIISRKSIPDFARKTYNEKITAILKSFMSWETMLSLHIYESIEVLGEVDTSQVINFLERTYPKLRIYTSRKINDTWTIVNVNGIKVKNVQFDVIVVPMVGFDDQLNRLGQGGGYYDAFLSAQAFSKKIGLCFEIGHVGSLPSEPHDQPMDFVLSETTFYTSQGVY